MDLIVPRNGPRLLVPLVFFTHFHNQSESIIFFFLSFQHTLLFFLYFELYNLKYIFYIHNSKYNLFLYSKLWVDNKKFRKIL